MHAYIARICSSFIDVPDTSSISIYFSGCSIHCKECHNKELWSRDSGKPINTKDVIKQVEEHPLADNVVFVGGEPTDQPEALKEIASGIKTKERVLYTGREFEDLPEDLLPNLDLIICGPYKSELHIGGWPASSNQRILKREGVTWKQLEHQTT